jgi:hypothetical protein
MATTSDLHVLGTDIKIADFSKILAKGAVERPIAGGIVSAIRTCRYI